MMRIKEWYSLFCAVLLKKPLDVDKKKEADR